MKSPSGFGRQPNVSNKIKKNVVSEQAAQQPTIEMGLIRKVRIQVQNTGSLPACNPESSLFMLFFLQACLKPCCRNRNSRLRLRCDSCLLSFAYGERWGPRPPYPRLRDFIPQTPFFASRGAKPRFYLPVIRSHRSPKSSASSSRPVAFARRSPRPLTWP